MIMFRLPIPSISDTITNPVMQSVIKEIKSMLNITDDTSFVIDDGYINDNWNIVNPEDPDKQKPFIIKVSYEETIKEESFYNNGRLNPKKPIFQDGAIIIKPVYINSGLRLTFNILTKSKTSINLIKNTLLNILLSGQRTLSHNVFYRYYLDKRIELLFSIFHGYKVEQGVIDYGIEKYLLEHSDSRLTLASNVAGENINIVYKETQTAINGMLEADINIKPEFEKEKGIYSLEFETNITYEKVMYTDIEYPISIANKLLPKELIVMKKKLKTNYSANKDMVNKMYDLFRNDNYSKKFLSCFEDKNYISIPDIDSPVRTKSNNFYTVLMSLLILIERDKPRELFNLKEIPNFKIHEDVLEFLQEGEYNYINLPFESIFSFRLMVDNEFRDDIHIRMDNDLNLYTEIDLDMDKQYRVFFSISKILAHISNNARKRLKLFLEKKGYANLETIILSEHCHFHNRGEWLYNLTTPFQVMIDQSIDLNLNAILPKTVAISYIRAFIKDK